jgi:hypothetical protein
MKRRRSVVRRIDVMRRQRM